MYYSMPMAERKSMRIYSWMFSSIRKTEENKRVSKLKKRLSFIQRIKLFFLDRKIYNAMKNGKKEILVDFIEERLILELQQRGFFVGNKYLGCSALHMTVYYISWTE